MTDYSEARSVRCKRCGVLTCDIDPQCDCMETYKTCPDCGIELDAELFPILEGCLDHEQDRDELREMARQERDRAERYKSRVKELEIAIKALQDGLAELREG